MSQIPIEHFAQVRSDYDAALAQKVIDDACNHQLRGFDSAQGPRLVEGATLALSAAALIDGLPSMFDPALVDAQKLSLARKHAVQLRAQPRDRTEAEIKNAKERRRLAAQQLLQLARDPKGIAAVAVGAGDAIARAYVHEPNSGAPWAKNVCWTRVKQIVDLLDKSKDPIVLYTTPYRKFMIDLLEREKQISATMASWPWLKHSLASIIGSFKDWREGGDMVTGTLVTAVATGSMQIIALVGSAVNPWVTAGVNIAKAVGSTAASVGGRKGGTAIGERRAARALVEGLKTGKESLSETVALRAMMYKAEPAFFKSSWHFGKTLRAFERLKAYTESPVVAETRSANTAPAPAPTQPPPRREDGGSIQEVPPLRLLVMQPSGTGGADGHQKRLDAVERLGEIAREGPPAETPAKDAIRDAIGRIVYGGGQKRKTEFTEEEQELLEALRAADPGLGTADTTVSDFRETLLNDPEDVRRINAAGSLKAIADHPKYAMQVKATLEEALNAPSVKTNEAVKAAVNDALGRSTEHGLTNDPSAEWNQEVREFTSCDEAVNCARDLMKFLHHYDKCKAYLFPVLIFLEYILAKSEGWRELWEGGYQGSRPLRDMSGVLKALGRMDHNNCRHPDKLEGLAKVKKAFTHKDLCYKGGVPLKDDEGVFKGKSKKGSRDRASWSERRRERQKFIENIKACISMLREPPIVHLDSGAEQDDQRRFAAATTLGKYGGRAMSYNDGEVTAALLDAVENDPSDRVRTAAREAIEQIRNDLPKVEPSEYSDLFKHHDPSKGARFARFVGYAGREPDILNISKTSDPVGQCVLRLGGTVSKVTSQLEAVKDAAKRKDAQKGTIDSRYACHVFDGHWTHTFKEPDTAPPKHRLALLLNHTYTIVENRASHQGVIKRGAYKFRRWAKDVRWRKVIIGVAVVGATVAVIAVSAATMGVGTPFVLAGSAVALGTVVGVGGAAGITLGKVVATGVSTAANASMQKSDIDEMSAKMSGQKNEKGKDEFAFKLGREGEDTFRKAISHFLRARKNMRRLASWNSPTNMDGKLVSPKRDHDHDLIFDKCRHGAKYAYAGMRFYHHYEKFARYILPCAWFAKFTLEYINRWDRYWDKMAEKFLKRIEETIARDQAWHDEHCGCKGQDPTTNVATKNKLNTITKAVTPTPKPESAYCYGQDTAYMNRLEWEPRRPLFPVLFATRSVTSPDYIFGAKHWKWLQDMRAQWKSMTLDRSATPPETATEETASPAPAKSEPPKRVMGVLVAMSADKTLTSPTRANTVDDLFAAIDRAEEYYASDLERYDPRELRLFLAPEWFFRKPGSGGGSTPLTHKEMRQTVAEICERSKQDQYARWLIFPGTIYFGLDYTKAVVGTDGTIDPAAVQDIKTYFRLPSSAADTSSIRESPSGLLKKSVQWIVGNLGLAVHKGQVIHYHFKANQQDIATADQEGDPPAHVWAMNLLTPAEALAQARSPLFTVSNLTQYKAKQSLSVAYDICRDHRVMVALYHAQNNGVSPDLQLVISNGVSMQMQSIAAPAGAYVLHCDGAADETRLTGHRVKTPTPARDVTKLRAHIERTMQTDADQALLTPRHAALRVQINELRAKIRELDEGPKLTELRKREAALVKEQDEVGRKMQGGVTPEHQQELRDYEAAPGAFDDPTSDLGKDWRLTFSSGGAERIVKVWSGRIVIDAGPPPSSTTT